MELRQILDGVESLEMVMPEFQREYVWPIEDAKQLLVSMFKGYPTGCLLFWETENPPEIKNKAVDTNKLGLTKVILDGHNEFDLNSGDSLKIKNSSTRYRLIHPTDYDYFEACRSKLYWGLPIVK